MRRLLNLVVVATCLALVGATLGAFGRGPLTVHASGASCKGCSDFSQSVADHNTGKASNSICFDQAVGGTDAKGNEGSMSGGAGACMGLGSDLCSPDGLQTADCLVDQEIGTLPGSKDNTGKMTNVTGQIVGLDQLLGSAAGNALFAGISGSGSDNEATMLNAGDDSNGCGPLADEFCGQLVAGGSKNTLSWANGHGNSQQVLFFDTPGGKGANGNTISVKGSHVSQWVMNTDDPEFLAAAVNADGMTFEPTTGTPSTGVLGLNASKNELSYNGSNGTQLVQNGSDNTLTNNGNFAVETVVDGSRNTEKTTGNSDTIMITGDSATDPANKDSVTIDGNYDTVTIDGVSDQKVTVKGNDITCAITLVSDTCP